MAARLTARVAARMAVRVTAGLRARVAARVAAVPETVSGLYRWQPPLGHRWPLEGGGCTS